MQQYRNSSLKSKRYGQVFSGQLIGDLLVSMLPEGLTIGTIIDPMAGKGDLLQSAHIRYFEAENVTGIEIDKDIIEVCRRAVPYARVFNEDAFKSSHVNLACGWDLVITNPPYVRYQTLKTNPEIGLPDGAELRKNLIEHISNSGILDAREKQLYLKITKEYSGLSDMAVPSWILCASLVKKGGYMAMVAPETWLNRDYALPIHYLLLRCFEIIAVARDVESAWFNDAEVRTCLVICKRKDNEPLSNSYTETVLFEINAEIMDSGSLVSGMLYKDSIGYVALKQMISVRAEYTGSGFESRTLPAIELFPGLLARLSEQRWVCKEDVLRVNAFACLPNEIKSIVSGYDKVEYDSLADLGWSVGQGIRSGANDFFYAELISEEKSMSLVHTKAWYGRDIHLSTGNFRKAVKKRGDVNGIVVEYDDLRKCIIYIQDQVRKKDYPILSRDWKKNYTLMNSELDDYISEAEEYISPKHKRAFRELSAVITNEKKTNDGYERFWYMLPALKERHVPNLCISRVCGESTEALYVKQADRKEIVVDANFITLWHTDSASQYRMFALLNSTWTKVFLEVIGTAMGGGALKVEASHMRKILFPRINATGKKELEDIGRVMLKEGNINKEILDKIDGIIASSFSEENVMLLKKRMNNLLSKKIQERTGRRYDE